MTTTQPTPTIPPEHHALVRELISWLRGEQLCPDHAEGVLGTLPGWAEYAADELTDAGWAKTLEQALGAAHV